MITIRTHAWLVAALLLVAEVIALAFWADGHGDVALACVPFILCLALTLWFWWRLGPGMDRAIAKATEDYYRRLGL